MATTNWNNELIDSELLQAQMTKFSSTGRELEMLPLQMRVVLIACAMMSGKTRDEARAAFRQAFNAVMTQK